jgi:hypothetical protein
MTYQTAADFDFSHYPDEKTVFANLLAKMDQHSVMRGKLKCAAARKPSAKLKSA